MHNLEGYAQLVQSPVATWRQQTPGDQRHWLYSLSSLSTVFRFSVRSYHHVQLCFDDSIVCEWLAIWNRSENYWWWHENECSDSIEHFSKGYEDDGGFFHCPLRLPWLCSNHDYEVPLEVRWMEEKGWPNEALPRYRHSTLRSTSQEFANWWRSRNTPKTTDKQHAEDLSTWSSFRKERVLESESNRRLQLSLQEMCYSEEEHRLTWDCQGEEQELRNPSVGQSEKRPEMLLLWSKERFREALRR